MSKKKDIKTESHLFIINQRLPLVNQFIAIKKITMHAYKNDTQVYYLYYLVNPFTFNLGKVSFFNPK